VAIALSHAGVSKSFSAMLKETSLAFSFGLVGILAGFIVASQSGIFSLEPSWVLALYPAIISAKGVGSGLLSGRLSTGLHLGTIYPKFFGNTKNFYKLIEVLIVLTLVTGFTICAISMVFGNLFWGITLAEFPSILSVIIATMTLGLLLSFVTIKVSFISFEKGLDPDIVVYPVMSTVADIFVTLCYVAVLNLFFIGIWGQWLIGLACLIPVFLVFYILSNNLHEVDFIKTFKESIITMLVVAFLVNITGTVLHGINSFVEGHRPEIITVYPALIGMIGNVGSVIGSTATTKLALGMLTPSFSSIKNHAKTIFSAWGASLIMFVVLAVMALPMHNMFSFSSFYRLILVVLLANILAVAAIVFLSYAVSILTFKRGLDPDNFVIPVESSLADSATSIALFMALLLIV
jgi:mgtE-like transporter